MKEVLDDNFQVLTAEQIEENTNFKLGLTFINFGLDREINPEVEYQLDHYKSLFGEANVRLFFYCENNEVHLGLFFK